MLKIIVKIAGMYPQSRKLVWDAQGPGLNPQCQIYKF